MLIVMQGVPGSGKTTTARKLAETIPHAVICSTDDYFTVNGGYRFAPELLSEYHTRNLAKAVAALADGFTVIVDNCNIKNEHAAPYVGFAHARGIPVVFVRCAESFRSVHGVPDATVERMGRTMETLSVGRCLAELERKSPKTS